jgi:hypothetical protein
MFVNEVILTFLVTYPSKNTSLKHVGGFASFNSKFAHLYMNLLVVR